MHARFALGTVCSTTMTQSPKLSLRPEQPVTAADPLRSVLPNGHGERTEPSAAAAEPCQTDGSLLTRIVETNRSLKTAAKARGMCQTPSPIGPHLQRQRTQARAQLHDTQRWMRLANPLILSKNNFIDKRYW